MRALSSAAGRAFLRAFGAAILTYSFGILAAPNLNQAYLLGVAALAASFAAGLRAIQAYLPAVSFSRYLPAPYGSWVDAFFQGSVGSLVVTLIGILDAPDLSFSRSVVTGLIVGVLTAGLHALQSATTRGELPNPSFGFAAPPNAGPVGDPAKPKRASAARARR